MDTNVKTFTAGKCPKCGGAAKDILCGMVTNPPGDVILGGRRLMPGFTHRRSFGLPADANAIKWNSRPNS